MRPLLHATVCLLGLLFTLSSSALAKSDPPDPCDEFSGAKDAAFTKSVLSEDARRRVAAAFCLPKQHPEARRLLEHALTDTHPFVRRAAAASAASIAPELLTGYTKNRDPYVRFWSVQAPHDAGAVSAVIDLQRATAAVYAKLHAGKDLSALRDFEGTDVAPVDLERRSGNRGWIRRWAPGTQATGEERLYELLNQEMQWLGALGDQRAIAALIDLVFETLLTKTLEPFRDGSVLALYRLVKLDPNTPEARKAIWPFIGLLRSDDHMNLSQRSLAMELILIWNAREAIPVALDLLDHQDGWVQLDAATLLGQFKAPEAVTPLIKLLARELPGVAVEEALANLAPASTRPLAEALRSGNSSTVRGAAGALALIGPAAREAVPSLLAVAVKDDPNFCSGLRALAAIEPASPRTADALLTFLENGGECLNWHMANLAAKFGPVPPTIVARLRKLLRSPAEHTRRDASAVLISAGWGLSSPPRSPSHAGP